MGHDTKPSAGERVHRVLLQLYPRFFRQLHGADILHAFRGLEHDAKHRSRWNSRVVRQLMTEGLLMSLLGGVLGFGVAWFATDFLIGLAPDGLPRSESIRVDPVVFAFTGGLATLVGLMCGLAPAVHLSGKQFATALAEIGRTTTAGTRANRVRSILVVIEFALSVVLLVGTGLLVQSFYRIQRVDPGFRIDDVLTMGILLPTSRYEDLDDRVRFTNELTQRVNALPGVVVGGVTTALPLTASANQTPAFKTEAGEFDPETAERSQVDVFGVTPGYFDAMGMTRIAGRSVEWSDRADGRHVAIIGPADGAVGWCGTCPRNTRRAEPLRIDLTTPVRRWGAGCQDDRERCLHSRGRGGGGHLSAGRSRGTHCPDRGHAIGVIT